MSGNRLEAFSDGVLAIVITIMVLEIRVPKGGNLESLVSLLPSLMNYLLSFVYIGIYWNNHHHLMFAARKINAKILWTNLNLLFWLSLMPFATAYMDGNHFEPIPTAFYGSTLLLACISWNILLGTMRKCDDRTSKIHQIYKNGRKALLSIALYGSGIFLSFFAPIFAVAIYIFVALMWIMPDTSLEDTL